jgi:hypothetical protein
VLKDDAKAAVFIGMWGNFSVAALGHLAIQSNWEMA